MKVILKVESMLSTYEFNLELDQGPFCDSINESCFRDYSVEPPTLEFSGWFEFERWFDHRFEEAMMHVAIYRGDPRYTILFDAPETVTADYGSDGWPTSLIVGGVGTSPTNMSWSQDMDADINCFELGIDEPVGDDAISDFIEWLWPDLVVGRD